MGKRKFEFARKVVNGEKLEEKAFPEAQIPVYMTKNSAGCDFFCAETIKVPCMRKASSIATPVGAGGMGMIIGRGNIVSNFKPTLVHTGIKADMQLDVVLRLYNRSSNPKRGLVLANGVGVIDADYYNNESNDGEIMFAFYNISDEDITIKAGERIGQGIFEAILRPEEGEIRIADDERKGGFGSTGKD